MAVTTLYATLGIDALLFGINQTATRCLIISQEQIIKLNAIIDKINTVSQIIVITDKHPNSNINEFKILASRHNISVFSFEEVTNKNEPNENYESPKADDLAIIMYTSGSTGNPKGTIYNRYSFFSRNIIKFNINNQVS